MIRSSDPQEQQHQRMHDRLTKALLDRALTYRLAGTQRLAAGLREYVLSRYVSFCRTLTRIRDP